MRAGLALGALGLALGLWVSRPLVVEWAHGLPLAWAAPPDRSVLEHATGDTLQLLYQLWLVRDGLLGPTPLGTDPYQFRVDGPRWNLVQTFPPLAGPFTLLSPLGLQAAYNLLVLLSFPLSALAAYGLLRHHGVDRLPAAAAGAAFAVLPARLAPLFGGQPAGFAAPLVPAMLWGLDLALTRGSAAGGALAGGALCLLAMLEPHYTYLAGGLAVGQVAWRGLLTPRRLRLRAVAPGLLLAALGAAWLLALRETFLVGSVAEAGRTLAEVRGYSPGPGALLAPGTYGGLAILLLAGLGLVAPTDREGRQTRVFYGGVLLAGLVLGLGPTVPGLPLYQALHRWLPLFGLIRNPEKFRLLTSVGGVVLAAYGLQALAGRVPGRAGRAVGAALAVALVAGTAPWHPILVTRWTDSAVYPRLRAEARRVLYLPVWPGDSAWSSAYLYHAMRTRVPMVNGYSPLVPRRYVAEVFEPLEGLNVGDVGPAEHALLRRLGVTHVVLDRQVFPPQVSPFPSALTRDQLRASTGLSLQDADDPLWVFRVGETPPRERRPVTSPIGVFFEAESLPRETGSVADEPGASGGRAVRAGGPATRPGFLTFGPYRLLPAGAYAATFRVRGRGLAVDVAVARGARVVAERRIEPTPAWADARLPFVLDRAQAVELRVRWDGSGEAAADWVSVVFADRPDPEWSFEVEDLPHLLGERPDPAASGGWAGYADPVESRRIPVVTGPARLYPAGAHRVTLRARADAPVRGPLLRLTVTEPAGRVLATRDVDAADLPPGAYGEVGLDFRLDRAAVLEFPAWYLGGTGVMFDRVTVTPR